MKKENISIEDIIEKTIRSCINEKYLNNIRYDYIKIEHMDDLISYLKNDHDIDYDSELGKYIIEKYFGENIFTDKYFPRKPTREDVNNAVTYLKAAIVVDRINLIIDSCLDVNIIESYIEREFLKYIGRQMRELFKCIVYSFVSKEFSLNELKKVIEILERNTDDNQKEHNR